MNQKNRRFSAIAVALVFALVSFGAAVSFADDSVAIETAFTDPVFRDAIALRYDTDKDGKETVYSLAEADWRNLSVGQSISITSKRSGANPYIADSEGNKIADVIRVR